MKGSYPQCEYCPHQKNQSTFKCDYSHGKFKGCGKSFCKNHGLPPAPAVVGGANLLEDDYTLQEQHKKLEDL